MFRFNSSPMALGLMAIALVATLLAIDGTFNDLFAQSSGTSSNVFSQLENKSRDIFYNARTIILIICALAIIVTMATAISGRFPISKALAIVGAIIVIGVASQIVTYFAGSTTTTASGTIPSLTDTAN